MKLQYPSLLCSALFLYAASSHAQPEKTVSNDEALEPVVVTATLNETPAEELGASVTIIDRQQIEASGKHSVSEILDGTLSLDVIRNGGPGGSTSLFTRGTESNHTLILIDGVEIADPSLPGAIFNFGDLPINDIERIEIIRGPLSTVYGSDAIGGVINIITSRRKGGFGAFETGAHGTNRMSAGIHNGVGNWAFGGSVTVLDTDGISAANKKDGNSEDDGYKSQSLRLYGRWQPNNSFAWDTSIQTIESETEIDEFGFNFVTFTSFFADDPDAHLTSDLVVVKSQLEWGFLDNSWRQRLAISLTNHNRESRNGPAGANPNIRNQAFEGDKTKIELINNIDVNQYNHVVFGLETEKEEADDINRLTNTSSINNLSARTRGVYLQNQFSYNDAVFVTAGLRHDSHEDFGGESTWRITPLVILPNLQTRLKGSYGTGFKAPSVNDLFQSFPPFFVSNPNLTPETSTGWEIGFEQPLFDEKVSFGVTWFNNEIEDLITFIPGAFPAPGTLANVDKAETDGYEANITARFGNNLRLSLNHSSLDAKNKTTNTDLLRRADSLSSLVLHWQAHSRLGLNIKAQKVGQRDDITLAGTTTTLDSYKVVDVGLSFDATDKLVFTLRVENAFDEEYEQTLGFGTPGRGLYLGLRVYND